MDIIKPDDFHIHIRQGKLLKSYLKDYENYVSRIIPMPNTIPPIDTPEKLIQYKKEIKNTQTTIEPLMIFKLHDELSSNLIPEFKKLNVIAGKLYPIGATTNASEGVSSAKTIFPILSEMEKHHIPLSIHGELMTSFSLDREFHYQEELLTILKNFPRLKIILEHLSDRRSVDFIEKYSKKYSIAGTITIHHPLLDLDDLLGDNLNPHHFCKPIIKTPLDKKRLQEAMFSQNPAFFFGSDSAPHLVQNKEKDHGSAGIYSAPVAIPLLFDLFDQHDQLSKLENFTSKFGAEFYELPTNKDTISMKKETWTVNKLYSESKPFYYKKQIHWQLDI